ncbi:hypothetical protein ABH922_000757 [Rhodococcus sp. 27YEA15]|uniref:hypothetical protein n=1 Tax=Rhodococcus sp. 27YEA15 TaxID=3156259 RepID=UPI003C7BDC33
MGFSIYFMRVAQDRQLDADRDGIVDFLDRRGLHVVANPHGCSILDNEGVPVKFDGYHSDLLIDSLEQDKPLTGGIDHATLTNDECEFVYDLCVAAGFLIVNPQGSPTYVVPHRNHMPDDLPDLDDTAWVESGSELSQALTGSFGDFRVFRNRVISQSTDTDTDTDG